MMYQSTPSRWPSDNTSMSLIACLEVNEIRRKQPLLNPEIITLKNGSSAQSPRWHRKSRACPKNHCTLYHSHLLNPGYSLCVNRT